MYHPPMGWISVVFAHKVIGVATRDVPDGETLRARMLRSVGLDPAAPVDPVQVIGDSDFFGLLERIAERVERGRDVALRVGASMRCDDYGAFGLAFKSAVNLESSYVRVERYGRVVTSIANFRVINNAQSAFMEVIPGDSERPGLLMTNELALAAATALSREVGEQDFSPLAVHLSHVAPDDVSAFEEHFRCPIHFGARRDALEVSYDQLRRPNRLGDTSISRFFDTHLDDALADLPEDGGLGRRVRAEIAQALSEGVPKLSRLAAQLGMSGRTLQRRLAGAGLSYRDLVDEARKELADRLLLKTDYDLTEIAFLTGFSEQSAFHRAFSRWTSQTPRSYREAARSSPA
ncbi:MAG: AraC family transcriptional regulator ligand-binding domain-containing protein [Acidobacteriota bacterium]